MKRGEMITPLIACANLDPEQFENPTRFMIDREKNYHVTFGSGPHVCLGMKLARSETKQAVKTLFEALPKLSPAFDVQHPDWSKRIGVRGFKTMLLKSD